MSKNVIAVKGVPPDLYRRVKSAAAGMGISLGTAVSQALELWLTLRKGGYVDILRGEIVKKLDEMIGYAGLGESRFARIYSKLVDQGRRCFVAGDIFNKGVMLNDTNCLIVIRDLVKGSLDGVVSIVNLLTIIETATKENKGKIIKDIVECIPFDKVASLNWQTLIKAIDLSERYRVSILHGILFAQIMDYDLRIVISTDPVFDNIDVIRVDPSIK